MVIKKNILGLALVVVTTVMACSSALKEKTVEKTGEGSVASTTAGLPAFTMYDLEGKTVSLQSLHGKKVFVNLWATWCPPCRAEMPSIEKLYASVDKSKVAFVMLSFDENPETARKFVQSKKLSLPVYFPAENPPAILQTDGIPATFIFDETGKLIKQTIGGENYYTDTYKQLLQ